jgi:hypothetical protein
MARILYSGSVSEMKGSIKGTTYQRNCAGTIAKGKNNAKFKASQEQGLSQKVFAYLTSEWNKISFGYKDEWNSFAAAHTRTDFWGNSKTISGLQWYLSINRAAYLLGESLLENPPEDADVASLPTISMHATSNTLYAGFVTPQDLTGMMCVILCSGPRRSTSASSRPPYLFMIVDGDGVIETIDFLAEWEAAYGISWASYYANNNAGLLGFAYAINLDNFVSSSYSPMAWAKS